MAIVSQEIEMLGCDSEGCEIKAPAVDGTIPEKFEAGTVHPRYVDDEPVAWVACRKTHISGAVLAAKARALAESADPTPAPEAAGSRPEDTEPVRGDEDDDGERRRQAEEADLESIGA